MKPDLRVPAMSRLGFAEQLESAANDIGNADRAEMQILLRRAAIRFRNIEGVPFDSEWSDALNSAAVDLGLTRSDMIRRIIKDWLIGHVYLPGHMDDEANKGKVALEPELVELFDTLAAAAEPPINRDDMVCVALVDWAIGRGYIDAALLDEESEVDGNA